MVVTGYGLSSVEGRATPKLFHLPEGCLSKNMVVPIAARPTHLDQTRNATLITEVLGTGIYAREWAHRGEKVTSAMVVEVVRRFMGLEEKCRVRQKAAELGIMVQQSDEEGGIMWFDGWCLVGSGALRCAFDFWLLPLFSRMTFHIHHANISDIAVEVVVVSWHCSLCHRSAAVRLRTQNAEEMVTDPDFASCVESQRSEQEFQPKSVGKALVTQPVVVTLAQMWHHPFCLHSDSVSVTGQ